MIDLYYWPTPNGHKITIFLEETGLPYSFKPVNIGRGEQFKPDFLKIAPNNRMPAIVDHAPADGGAPVSVFESGAILVYLAEKTGRFLPTAIRPRVETLQWLFWQMGGLGPMAGQTHHFVHYAPEKIDYAMKRYVGETSRLYAVLDKRLGGSRVRGRRLFHRRYGELPVGGAVRAPEPEARGVSQPEALVRSDSRPARSRARLREGQGGQHPAYRR